MRDRLPLLPGLAFSGYRSFASEAQRFTMATPVTVLAGINNSGKSNVLRYVQEVLPALRLQGNDHFGEPIPRIDGLDLPSGYGQKPVHRIAIPLRFEPMTAQQVREVHQHGAESLDLLQLAVMTLLTDDELMWPEFVVGHNGIAPSPRQVRAGVRALTALRTEPGAWWTQGAFESSVAAALNATTPNNESPALDWAVASLLRSLAQFESIPPVTTVSASRRLEIEDGSAVATGHDWMSGRGLVKRLAELQNPVAEKWTESRSQWDAITRFVQWVLDDRDAHLNIPFGADIIQVETPRRVLPLSNLGSGIEQVVVLAAAATMQVDTLVCMEEPESNLHPVLQRKLVRYLADATSNQYLIATHSAHFLDFESASVYHLRLQDEGTVATRVRTADALVEVCNDLGYRPSDLMQTNCIIWVEGPSDRIYLRKWLDLVTPDLHESVDYKIMFYGGSLLTHLTVADEHDQEIMEGMVNDFVNLRLLNRASVILMDSDRSSPDAPLKPAVERLLREYDTGPGTGHAWVTYGYTVENYLPQDVLVRALAEVHPSKEAVFTSGAHSNPLQSSGINKVAVARHAVLSLHDANFITHDLRERLDDLAQFIRSANSAVTDTPHTPPEQT